MSVAQMPQPDTGSVRAELLSMTLRACELARTAVAAAADALATRSDAPFRTVNDCEKELDRLDREVDDRVTVAVTQVGPEVARDLLACMKFMLDLERIGDLISSLVGCARAVGQRINMEDVNDLLKMAALLEKMLRDAHQALEHRDLESAIAILRADSEIDRLRNLILIRHVEDNPAGSSHESVHVMFMAQALERAGDHAKNLAEEVCHLVSGHSMRHVMRESDKSYEQMYLKYLREKQPAHK
ncbi:MAG TPA: PhoU domain-containing protein [Terriglobales bacterium]|nr:PhoU domain-containing protein [Terriglobales bacterium]